MDLTIFGDDLSGISHIASFFRIISILGIYFLVSFPVGLFCRTLMKTKGYDGSKGFLLGFFLSFVGMVICAFMPFQNAETPYQPQYGQPYEPQYGQPPYGQPMQGQPMMNQPQGVQCASCGMINPPNAQHCMQCGEKLF